MKEQSGKHHAPANRNELEGSKGRLETAEKKKRDLRTMSSDHSRMIVLTQLFQTLMFRNNRCTQGKEVTVTCLMVMPSLSTIIGPEDLA